MKLCMKYFRNLLLVIVMGLILSSIGNHNAFAQISTSFKRDLGGIPISCSVSIEQVAINGIHAGDSPLDVYEKLGKPNFVSRGDHTLKYTYGSLLIYFMDLDGDGHYTAYDISSSNKTSCTPDGVSVGMSDSVLSNIYGTADRVKIITCVSPKLSSEIDASNQKELNETTYIYNFNECLSLSFTVKNGIIKTISIHQSE